MPIPEWREAILIDAPASTVWPIIADASGIASWFPQISEASCTDNMRSVVLIDGSCIEEVIVSSDDLEKRLQYSIVGGDVPVQLHLATIEVVEVGERCIVLFFMIVEPAELAPIIGEAWRSGLQGLKKQIGAFNVAK